MSMRTVLATFDKDQVPIEMPVAIGAHRSVLSFGVSMCMMRLMGPFHMRPFGLMVMVMAMVAVSLMNNGSVSVIAAVRW